MIRCPSPDDLRRLLADELSSPEAETVEAHLEGCADCRQALEQLTAESRHATGGPADLPEDFLRRLQEQPPDGAGPAPDPEAATLSPREVAGCGDAPPTVAGYEILGELGRG